MPSTEPSPRPWRIGENSLGWKSCIEDADGKQIASCWGDDGVNCTEPAQSDAALIVDAVNERDRLRDIVRRLLPLAETTVENIRALGTSRFPFLEQIKSDRLRGDINREVANADHLLREASAAIGEDTP